MRYDCDDPAFAGDFIDFSDSFSRKQQDALYDAAGKDDELFWSLLRPKVLAVHLSCVDAGPITRAEELTPERADDMDVRIFRWLNHAWLAHLGGLITLGNALGRRLYAISATTTATMEAVPANQNHS